MKIKVNGSGKMGTLVRQVAEARGHHVSSDFDNSSEVVCIDFTHASAVLSNVREAIAKGANIVIGTTGWEDIYSQIKEMVAHSNIGLLYSPNFSIGAHIHRKVCAYAASLTRPYSPYKAAIIETHHSEKADAPSGTAKKLKQEIQPFYPDIEITSMRHGHDPGNHTLILDAPEDTLFISHQARSREGFALGAVIAAEWLKGKRGIFTMDDIL